MERFLRAAGDIIIWEMHLKLQLTQSGTTKDIKNCVLLSLNKNLTNGKFVGKTAGLTKAIVLEAFSGNQSVLNSPILNFSVNDT